MNMLLSFSVANFGSIRDLQTLKMTADKSKDERGILLEAPKSAKARVGRVAAIYGANASGKSTVLDAFDALRKMVRYSHERDQPLPVRPFLLAEVISPNSSLAVYFVADGARYLYEVEFSRETIVRETLHAWTTHRKAKWFERVGQEVDFGETFHSAELGLLRGMIRPNSLFLSVAAQNSHKRLRPVYEWFRRVVFRDTRKVTIQGSPNIHTTEEFGDELLGGRDETLTLLQAADVGIIDLKFDELPRRDDAPGLMTRRFRVESKHSGGGESWLPFSAESQGTRAMFDIALVLKKPLSEGGVVVIDEIEGSLHPMLVLELVRLFQDPVRNPKGTRLIFTTHDTNLLSPLTGPPALRRDQVWFTEKSQDGATTLYPLSDFHPREGESLERGYLQGRYGAVPFLGRLLLSDNYMGADLRRRTMTVGL